MSEQNKFELFKRMKTLVFGAEDSAESLDAGDVTSVEDVTLDVKTEDGKILRIVSTEIEDGAEIKEVTEDGILELADGTYVLEDKSEIIVKEGKIESHTLSENEDVVEDVEDAETSGNESFRAIRHYSSNFGMIKSIYVYEIGTNEDTFEIGTKVTVTEIDYDGNEEVREVCDGWYALEDGRTIGVDENGVIVIIKDKDGDILEVATVGENTNEDAPISEDAPSSEEEVEDVSEEEFNKVVENMSNDYSKLKEDYSKLKEEFELFKKEASENHTNVADTLKFDEKPKQLSNIKAQLKRY